MPDERLLAEITPVPARFRGRVLTSSAKLMENGIFVGQLVLFAAITFAPAILGGILATRQLFPGNNALSFAPVVVGLAATAGVGWLLGGQMLRMPWSANYMFRKAQSELGQRLDAIVDCGADEAIFVEVIPRRNWGQIALQSAEDMGFLQIDAARRQLVLEGDNKRYRIPAGAVASCDVELMNPSSADDPRGTPLGIVVLKVRDHLGYRELPLRPVRTVAGDALGGNYVQRANELQRRIVNACSEMSAATALA